MSEKKVGRCLGLVGGLGVGAAVHYYQELAKAHEARGASMRLLMAHAEAEQVRTRVSGGDLEGLAQYLAGLIGQMKAGGAEVAIVPAVAPHACARELAAVSPLPLVSMLDAARDEIKARGLRRVALFGTRWAMESGLFGALTGIELVLPRPDEVTYIHDTYFKLVLDGKALESEHAELTRLAQTLCTRDGVEAIVLAGTDFAVLFNETNTDFPHVDCAAAQLRAIMRISLGD